MSVMALEWGAGQWIGLILAVVVLVVLIVVLSSKKPGPTEPAGGSGLDEEAEEGVSEPEGEQEA